jgi:hypothetical protein
MGLDMFAHVVTAKGAEIVNAGAVQFDELDVEWIDKHFWYWRKNHFLHGWMQKLYAQKTGIDNPSTFNCVYVELTADDLDALELAINENALKATEGLFFGNRTHYDAVMKTEDLAFISVSRAHIAEGNHILYSSWW